jgi:outer membrane protein assembly factor BamB
MKLFFFSTLYLILGAIPSDGQTVNPEILWATYFGSPGDDFTGNVVIDKEDNIYMTSIVKSGAPTTTGVHKISYGGGTSDGMLTKFDKDGKLLWSTYYGGSGEDNVFFLALATDGAIAITGFTNSASGIASEGAHDVSYAGSGDIYLAVFEPDGKLRWATYFGGPGTDGREISLTIDSEDNIYLAGFTASLSGIATEGAYQSTKNVGEDAFLAKFDIKGKLLWSTYYGGVSTDYFFYLETDGENNVYAAGYTTSGQLASAGAFKPNYGGNGDGLLVKFNKSGERIWATYFGSGGKDEIITMGIDYDDNIYIMGPTTSTGGIATQGAYSMTNFGKQDVFIAKFNTSGGIIWSTLFGGEDWDTVFGCDFDEKNNVYLSISSKSIGFPLTEDVPGPYYNGGAWDAVFCKFSSEGNLKWSTFFGGEGNDRAIDISLDSQHNIVATINSDSPGLATSGAYDTIRSGNESLIIKMKDVTTVNIEEIHTLGKIQCFPNPTSDIIEIPNPLDINRNIIIFDANGAMVLRHINTYQSQFKIRNLPPGIYYILLDENGVISPGKFLKVE